jgi:hypothetical protein
LRCRGPRDSFASPAAAFRNSAAGITGDPTTVAVTVVDSTRTDADVPGRTADGHIFQINPPTALPTTTAPTMAATYTPRDGLVGPWTSGAGPDRAASSARSR